MLFSDLYFLDEDLLDLDDLDDLDDLESLDVLERVASGELIGCIKVG